MIIRIFKISTEELWVFRNKDAFRRYVVQNVMCVPKHNATINELMDYLPVEDYCRVE